MSKWVSLALFCLALSAGVGARAQQGLPPLPKAAVPAQKAAGKAPEASKAAAAPVEAPLVPELPKEIAKSDKPCAELDAKAVEWLEEALGRIQAQALRSNGAQKARDGFADAWMGFKALRSKGYNADTYSSRMDALFRALYPAGAFAPESPFERFKEPRFGCKAKPAF